MKIYGVGTDIVKISRIKSLIKKKTIKSRLFSSKEILKCKNIKNSHNCYAKRFAAKEAFSKALGIGLRMNLNFKDIEVVNDKMGKPYYVKNKKITKIIHKKFKIKNYKCFLSISDEKNYSTAFAINQTS